MSTVRNDNATIKPFRVPSYKLKIHADYCRLPVNFKASCVFRHYPRRQNITSAATCQVVLCAGGAPSRSFSSCRREIEKCCNRLATRQLATNVGRRPRLSGRDSLAQYNRMHNHGKHAAFRGRSGTITSTDTSCQTTSFELSRCAAHLTDTELARRPSVAS